ncbi:F0F1 ATP synthase subunit epsilon [Methylovirgula sp. 4M-Z18]|uniref:F0F1 ATP synthase subunit epsilon n=1 Tax=Methylovirgula sp. 4M-Z18 TaxID=2293567 RepID=UPI000E2EA0E1|nr:F0F1 ATP synthase subunit epsilon [Methylovirgula sp. 4M-Z18]RFB78231.1 F0F1 ATP synthase subunit epsilon [Methylovirgula sp. 4M-Z18]
MATFHFELVSPEKQLFIGEVEDVIVPGSEGQFTVLANHAPVMTTLRPGLVIMKGGSSGAAKSMFVRGGFAEVAPTGLTILAEYAIPLEELNELHLAAEIKHLEEEAASASEGEAKRIATERLNQLNEVKATLRLGSSGGAERH